MGPPGAGPSAGRMLALDLGPRGHDLGFDLIETSGDRAALQQIGAPFADLALGPWAGW